MFVLSAHVSSLVTAVDSGSKALEFLGIHEDEENEASIASVSPNDDDDDDHQVYDIQTKCVCGFSVIINLSFTNWSLVSMLIQDVDISLIITDYCMPEMTGYDLLRKIKVSLFVHKFDLLLVTLSSF